MLTKTEDASSKNKTEAAVKLFILSFYFFMTDTLCKGQRSLKRRIGQFALQGSSFVSFVPFGPFLIFPLKKLHSRSIHPSVEGMDLILAE